MSEIMKMIQKEEGKTHAERLTAMVALQARSCEKKK